MTKSEAQYAHSQKDFISKLEITLKEASETGYWLELAYKTNYIDENQYENLPINAPRFVQCSFPLAER